MKEKTYKEDLRIYEKDFTSPDCFEGSYAVGTTGFVGGDSSRTVIEFKFGGGCIEIKPIKNKNGFQINASGDAELRYIMEAFEWIVKKLKEQT